jgi:predicted methyltransferase
MASAAASSAVIPFVHRCAQSAIMGGMIPQFEDSLMSTPQSFKALCAAIIVGLATSATTALAASAATSIDPQLAALVANPQRSAPFVARDAARHPAEELSYFGLKPDMTVVELWPGSGYWTEILGPYLAKSGHYYVSQPVPGNKEEDAGVARWQARVDGMKGRVGLITQTVLGKDHYVFAPPGSADLVVTFRNLHNWVGDGYAEQVLAGVFHALKPGGVLGIEDHRGRTDKPQDPKANDGYLRQDYAIALAKKAGFEFVGASEINANPKDTKDWVDGVWTLPPTLSQGDKDRARYVAIGEADNFVLKFRKPMK